eukprot:SAG31_NODE_38065_length_299_cov_0.780000_1_plen_50_part_01
MYCNRHRRKAGELSITVFMTVVTIILAAVMAYYFEKGTSHDKEFDTVGFK